MNSSPGPAAVPSPPVLQVARAPERDDPHTHFPALYSSSLAVERGAVCIPSPFADTEFGPGPLNLGHPVSESPGLGPPLSPSLFWPSHTTHAITLHCPPQLMYGEPHTHAAWAETKPHTPSRSSSLVPHMKLFGKQLEDSDKVLNSSSSETLAKADLHYCVVCSDYASGYHYGVWSCEGCKAFFKRSIQGHNDYICPATNQCTIDKNRRKSCQACRLRKCYEVGMMKCGVRRERCSYRGARHRRVPQVRESSGVVMGVRGHSQQHPQLHQPLSLPAPELRAPGLSPEQLVQCMLDAEPPDIYLKQEMKKPYTEASVMMSLTNLADKELVVMISWAKKIPGFVELNLSLQVQLLECCWLEVLMLGLMWRSVDHPGNLIFCPDLILSRYMILKYDYLKALLINSYMTSPESDSELEGRSKLLHLLDTMTNALVWAISRTGLSTQQQSARLAHLLMLLSHIRHLSNKGMEHLSSMKRKNVVLLYDLMLEMLDANTPSRSRISGAQCTSPGHAPPIDTPPHTNPASENQSPVAHQLVQNVEEQNGHE
uniref:Estrogen receptor 2b n=1 Tax=Astyanax mexicanus TaxID=7994 RepID=W5KLY7_ASTMX